MKRMLFRDRRVALKVKQRKIEVALQLPSGSLSVLENGRLPTTDEFWDRALFPTLERLGEEHSQEKATAATSEARNA